MWLKKAKCGRSFLGKPVEQEMVGTDGDRQRERQGGQFLVHLLVRLCFFQELAVGALYLRFGGLIVEKEDVVAFVKKGNILLVVLY